MKHISPHPKSKPEREAVLLFTRNGMGHAPTELQQNLVVKFLSLTLESGDYPARIVFYTEGVRLACQGSPVIDLLRNLEVAGVELVLCKTCLDYFGLGEQVAVGTVGGMADILETLQKAPKVISL